MFYVIAYDIESDGLRDRVAKTLEGFGNRVQYSVFECNLTPEQYEALKARLARLLEPAPGAAPANTSIRCYPLCRSCSSRIDILGEGRVSRDPSYYIV